MATAMVAVLAAVALGSGLTPASQEAQASHIEFINICTYEAGTGDLAAVMKSPEEAQSFLNDDAVDQGGCIWNRPNHDDCVTTVTRGVGDLATALGDLSLGEIASRMSVDGADCPVGDMNLREFPSSVDSGLAEITVQVTDDAFGTDISGLLCTEGIDSDDVACEDDQVMDNKEWQGRICGSTLKDGPLTVQMSQVEHVVVFIDGPAGDAEALEDCGQQYTVVGGTTGGVFDPDAGVEIRIDKL